MIVFSQDFIKTSGDGSEEEERSHNLKMERRKSLMQNLERAMIKSGDVEDTQGVDDIEVLTYDRSLVQAKCKTFDFCKESNFSLAVKNKAIGLNAFRSLFSRTSFQSTL